MITQRFYSWAIRTTLDESISVESLRTAIDQVVDASRQQKVTGWLVDASQVVHYDDTVFGQITDALKFLVPYGVRYVAFLHPMQIVKTAVELVSAPPIRIHAFTSGLEAEQWFRHSCT